MTKPFASEPGGDAAGDSGPAVYRLARAHRSDDAVVEVERLTRERVARIERSAVGSSHAVYLVTLEGGQQCVARFATHAEHRLDREVWASEWCRQVGLPVPRVLASDLAPMPPRLPLAIYEHVPGLPGHRAALNADERTAVFEQMGAIAARLHQIRVPGIGPLERRGDGWAGTGRSWADYNLDALTQQIRRLPPGALPLEMAFEIRRRFETARLIMDAAIPEGPMWSALVHGDLRLENTLIAHDENGGIQISAVLDFEMVLAGDGGFDLAWLLYRDAEDYPDAAAVLGGYGLSELEQAPEQRLLLYQLRCAIEHLWWKAEFQDSIGVTQVQKRISALLDSRSIFTRHKTAEEIEPPKYCTG